MSIRQESLWLDDARRSATFLQSEKIQNKLFKFIKHFDNKQVKRAKKVQPSKFSRISSPISFSHVAHIDRESNFGLHRSFGTNSGLVIAMVPEKQQPRKRTSSSYSNSDLSALTESLSSIEEEPEPYTSVLDPAALVKAISSYRTSPAPVSLSKSSSLKRHTRNSSTCSTTFSGNASRMSYQSESTTISSPVEKDLRKHVLSIIPQEEMEQAQEQEQEQEQEEDFANRFVGIPSAPPPPPQAATLKVKANMSLETLLINNPSQVDFASDSDSEIDDAQLEKFRFSNNIETLITTEIEKKFREKFHVSGFKMSDGCRNSIIQLLKNEVCEKEGINTMLSGNRMTEILEVSETESGDSDLEDISFIDTTLTLDIEDIELSDIEV